jgi:hypothetical protein
LRSETLKIPHFQFLDHKITCLLSGNLPLSASLRQSLGSTALLQYPETEKGRSK